MIQKFEDEINGKFGILLYKILEYFYNCVDKFTILILIYEIPFNIMYLSGIKKLLRNYLMLSGAMT